MFCACGVRGIGAIYGTVRLRKIVRQTYYRGKSCQLDDLVGSLPLAKYSVCYNSKGSQPPKLGTSCTTLIAVSPDPLFPREGLACETREVSTLMAKSIAFLASGSDPTDVYVLVDYAALTVDALPLAGCVDSA